MAASIGVAFSQPGDDTEQLLRNADIAMYNAKAAGKARFVVFHPRMQEQLHDRLRLEEDINRALERNEFFLEFQPVIDLTHRELLGVEALVRWKHPKQGLVMPGAFIPIAEESGQIVELGRWVLVEACRAGPRLAPIRSQPATACASRSTSPAAICSTRTWWPTCATRSRSRASIPATW